MSLMIEGGRRLSGDLKPDSEGALKQVLAAYTEQFTKEK